MKKQEPDTCIYQALLSTPRFEHPCFWTFPARTCTMGV